MKNTEAALRKLQGYINRLAERIARLKAKGPSPALDRMFQAVLLLRKRRARLRRDLYGKRGFRNYEGPEVWRAD
jgi:hypothetical protein